MTASNPKSLSSIGFLTVLRHCQHGLFGGYLLVNPAGRPLEFHCTAPVRANRAQEILYGATLLPYLCGEQIAGALLAKAKTRPQFVCTDVTAALALRPLIEIPVAWVDIAGGSNSTFAAFPPRDDADAIAAPLLLANGRADNAWERIDDAPQSLSRAGRFAWGSYAAAVANEHIADRETVLAATADWIDTFDLAEPFARIRDAICETQQLASA